MNLYEKYQSWENNESSKESLIEEVYAEGYYQQLDESGPAIRKGADTIIDLLTRIFRRKPNTTPNVRPDIDPFDITQQPGYGVNRPDLYDDVIETGDDVVYGRPDFVGPQKPNVFDAADDILGPITPDDWTYHGPMKPPSDNPFDITQQPGYGDVPDSWPFNADNPHPSFMPPPGPIPFRKRK
tara:strand:+ start:126 stop:674 length:549 start_codon:yes stop_codon:yes gene_type:complete